MNTCAHANISNAGKLQKVKWMIFKILLEYVKFSKEVIEILIEIVLEYVKFSEEVIEILMLRGAWVAPSVGSVFDSEHDPGVLG